jgi:hypothetical protein
MNDLPLELLFFVAQKLHIVDLVRLRSVNSQFREILNSDDLFVNYFAKYYSLNGFELLNLTSEKTEPVLAKCASEFFIH